MQWHQIKGINHCPDGTIWAQCFAPEDSPWFEGHFPERPVLPGIAQLRIITEILDRVYCQQIVRCLGIRNVRFKKAISPEELMQIQISAESPESTVFKFKISCAQELACTGKVHASIGQGCETSSNQFQ